MTKEITRMTLPSRYWEPTPEEMTEEEQRREWEEFIKWTQEKHEPDSELPFA